MAKRGIGSRLFDWANIAFFLVCAFTMVFPLWNVLTTSLVGAGEYYSRMIVWWPQKFDWTAYQFLFNDNMISRSFVVTALLTLFGSAYNLLLTTMLAYGLSKKLLPGRNTILLLITITMFFDGGLIPYYMLIKDLNMMNTVWVLFIPGAVSVGNFIITKAFFSQLPIEVEESARIDGAGDFRIFARIILPLSTPLLATIFLFYAVVYWNSWYNVLLFIQNESLYTLQYVLRIMVVQDGLSNKSATSFFLDRGRSSLEFEEGVRMGMIVIAVVPILCVYPFLQKYFTKGVMIGSIKG
ncbi:MAG: carbohydrate ABC transporter permease [Paenibacillaceae bacterium]|nr:carbohydrate ABC transporter permease [Paenibacillaceae bacterium]